MFVVGEPTTLPEYGVDSGEESLDGDDSAFVPLEYHILKGEVRQRNEEHRKAIQLSESAISAYVRDTQQLTFVERPSDVLEPSRA